MKKINGEEPWRKAPAVHFRAPKTYTGSRPFHQTYSHYKYYGAAGMGAKTAHAVNPKIARLKLTAADNER